MKLPTKKIKIGNNDDKTPDSAYGSKSTGGSNTFLTISHHTDDAASVSTASSLMTSSPKSPRYIQRNPVTGSGINDPLFKPKKGSFRQGNKFSS